MRETTSSAMKRYNHLLDEISAVYHDISLKLNITDSEMIVLYAIHDCGDRRALNEIVRITGVPKQTIHSAVKKLESRGVVRLEKTDGKHKEVCLTEEGIPLVQRTAESIVRAENEIFAGWDAQDVEKYLALTERFLNELRIKSREIE